MKRKLNLLLSLITLTSLAACNKEIDNEPLFTQPKEIVDYDVVGQTKIKLNDDVFKKVALSKSKKDFDEENYVDFQNQGVERMLTTQDYPTGAQKDVFTNYVDGDTTQFTSYNGLYSVKVRYLAINTPESTAQIEKWGKQASNFNKQILKEAKHVIVQSATSAREGGYGEADLDNYGRTLAYVWYSNYDFDGSDAKLTEYKNSFKNLNLELVYNGFSPFTGRKSDMDETFYNAFFDANNIAKYVKKQHIYSDDEDPLYWDKAPKELGLDELYDTSYYNSNNEDGANYSSYCDYKTRWVIEGVVSGKLGNAFYIQDTIDGKTYGLYCFTMADITPAKVGNRIKVCGVLQYYGGSYELTGLTYDFAGEDIYTTKYVDDNNGKHIKENVNPIDCTPSELASGKYECVLVNLLPESGNSDNHVYFNTTMSDYNGEITSYAYGGTEELNSYNDAHPFYNTSNDLILFGKYGEDMQNVDDFSTLSQDSNYIRMKIGDSCKLSKIENSSQNILSYRYFTGTTDDKGNEKHAYYSKADPKLVYELEHGKKQYDNLTEEEKAKILVREYSRKKVSNVSGIAQNYVSTGGNKKVSINITSPDQLTIENI